MTRSPSPISRFVPMLCGLMLSSWACGGGGPSVTGTGAVADKGEATAGLTPREDLGRRLFFDESLSDPPGQSCASCHDPKVAFADPVKSLPVSRGAVPGRYGNRNDLTAAYAAFVPPLHKDPEEDIWVGGLFWDGRANTLAEQAMGPPLNPLEMAARDREVVLTRLRALDYAAMFNDVFGPDALSNAERAFQHMADAIEAFVNFGCIATGILQILALNFHETIGCRYLGWLRTVSSTVPSEEVVTH